MMPPTIVKVVVTVIVSTKINKKRTRATRPFYWKEYNLTVSVDTESIPIAPSIRVVIEGAIKRQLHFFPPQENMPKRALDIGCGAGFVTTILADSNFLVDAIDKNKERIDECVRNTQRFIGAGRVNVSCADVLSIDFKKNWYDLIFCIHVLHLLARGERSNLLKNVNKTLKPRVAEAVFLFRSNGRTELIGEVSRALRIVHQFSFIHTDDEKQYTFAWATKRTMGNKLKNFVCADDNRNENNTEVFR